MFEEADHFADLFRGGLPYYVLITLPILIICSSNPVLASSEFSVQRMSQFDVHGLSYGELFSLKKKEFSDEMICKKYFAFYVIEVKEFLIID